MIVASKVEDWLPCERKLAVVQLGIHPSILHSHNKPITEKEFEIRLRCSVFWSERFLVHVVDAVVAIAIVDAFLESA